MKKTFFKNLFRDIRKTYSRFFSILIIIALGVAFYAGVRATSPDMKKSGDNYLKQTNFMDFKLISTLGLTKNDLLEVSKIKGVLKAEGSKSIDVIVEKDKRSMVLNVNSIPKNDSINNIVLISGNMPLNEDEIVVEELFLKQNHINIGDEIELKSGRETSLDEELNITKFKIVGGAKSPLYISAQRQLSSIGNGSVRGFLYILPEVFKRDIYNEIYLKVDALESKKSLFLNEEYKKSIEEIKNNLKDIGKIRNDIRYNEVLGEAERKLQEGEEKLNSSKLEAEEKFGEAYRKISDGKEEILKGRREILKSEAIFNEKIQEGEAQIKYGKEQILLSQNQIIIKEKEIEEGKIKIAQGKKEIELAFSTLELEKEKAASDISQGILKIVEEAKKQYELEPLNEELRIYYYSLKGLYEKDILGKDFDTMYSSLFEDGALPQINLYFDLENINKNFEFAKGELLKSRENLNIQEKLLLEGEETLNQGKKSLEIENEKLIQGEIKLLSEKKSGLLKLEEGRKKLDNGEGEIQKNLDILNEEEKKAYIEIKNGEEKLEESRSKIKDIKTPDWYVLGRFENVGYETYRQDSDRIDNIGKAFPLIFFLVAALVSLTTMTRMVQENRIEIGTFKALGYSRVAIISHYLIYALLSSLMGSILGISFGFRLFPPLIMNAYSTLYTIGDQLTPFNTLLALGASLIAILFTTMAGAFATFEELREAPSSLMRPKPPKSGKTILLERIPFIWKRLSFTKKVTARNIFRYKQRLFMTVIGIATCTGLMITGFGLKSGIVGAVEDQFKIIYKYDMNGALKNEIDTTEKYTTRDQIMEDSNVSSLLFTYTKNATVDLSKSGKEDVFLVVVENKEEINKYIEINSKGNPLDLEDNGVIITQKLSKLTGKKVGDKIDITLKGKIINVKISGITTNYIQHYVYISAKYYEEVTGEGVKYNGFYGLLKSKSEIDQDKTSKLLLNVKNVNSVSFKNNVQIDFNKTTKSINTVVLVLIISAGVLAFVVIYNLTNININERKRELATIKLLGFFNNELASYIYRENMILTVLGSLTGILVGMFLNNFVINTAETNVMMFKRSIEPIYFLYSVLLTLSFSVIVNLAMYGEFDKIDMIESLKNAE